MEAGGEAVGNLSLCCLGIARMEDVIRCPLQIIRRQKFRQPFHVQPRLGRSSASLGPSRLKSQFAVIAGPNTRNTIGITPSNERWVIAVSPWRSGGSAVSGGRLGRQVNVQLILGIAAARSLVGVVLPDAPEITRRPLIATNEPMAAVSGHGKYL
jgi:hypothetical protein